MASITLRVSDRFPVGTSLGAYVDVGWMETHPPPSSPTATGTVQADGTVTFANLSPSLNYRAGADMGGGIWRYIGFVSPPSVTTGQSLEPATADAVIYVSSNAGNDGNDGRSEGSAKATIAAAIAAIPAGVPGRVRFLPGSTHTISAQVNLRSDLTLDFNGALIQRAVGYAGDLFGAAAAVSRVTIQDGRFDNGASAQFGFDFPNGCSEITFRNNRVTGHKAQFFRLAIGAAFNKNVRIVGNSFYGDTTVEDQSSVGVFSPHTVWIEDNYFYGTGGFESKVSDSQSGPCRQVVIRGNTFENQNATCIGLRTGVGGTVLEDVLVANNTAFMVGSTVTLKGLVGVGASLTTDSTTGITRRVTIANNTLLDFYGAGISCGSGDITPTVYDFTVTGNVIDAASAVDRTVDTTRGTMGIRFDRVIGFTCSNNVVHNAGRAGIRVVDGCSNGTITGNIVDGCVANPTLTSPSPSAEAGIVVFQGDDITIMGNTVRNSSTAQGGVAGIGINSNGAPFQNTGFRIIGNRCYDDRTPKLQEYGVRLGQSGADSDQPMDVIVSDNDLRGNLTGTIQTFNTTPKNYVFHHNKDISGLLVAPLNPDPLRRGAFTSSSTLTIATWLAEVTDNSASRTMTLPLISAVPIGHQVIVKGGVGNEATRPITVAGQGTDTIEGAASKQINTNYGSLRVYSNGTQWMTF